MKKNIKLFGVLLFSVLIFPKIASAASLKFVNVETSEKNIKKYDIVLELAEGDNAIDILHFKLEDGYNPILNYSLDSVQSDTIKGSCNSSNEYSCYLTTTAVTSSATVATLTITNPTEQQQVTKLSIKNDDGLTAEISSVELNAKPIVTTTTPTTTTQRVLNSATTLSSLSVSVGVMDQPFNKDLYTYNVTGIKDTINSITVTPDCDNNCSWVITCPLGECSVSNSRRVTLQTGANKISVNVTSEDGQNNKSYILNVYRGEIETSSAYLSDIKIKDYELSPNFDTKNNDYTATVGMDVAKLEIETIAEDPEAKIEIKGNDNLIEGENTITITVTSSDNENKQVYTIVVTKEETEEGPEEIIDEEEKPPVTKVEKKKNNLWLIIVIVVLAIGAITTTAILIFRKNKKNDKNNKNNKGGGSKVENIIPEKKENNIIKENTDALNILNETRREMYNEPKQSIDDALDDLMQTKRLELGDLGL